MGLVNLCKKNIYLVLPLMVIFLFLSTELKAVERNKIAKGAPSRITPVILPFWSEGPMGKELGFGIVDRAGALLLNTGEYNHIHIKQVLSAAKKHGWSLKELSEPENAKKMAVVMGAHVAVYGVRRLSGSGGFEVSFDAFDLRSSKSVHKDVVLSRDMALAVRTGSLALANAAASFDSVHVDVDNTMQPDCNSSRAMLAYLACAAVLIEQPMGLRKSHVVDPARLRGARKKCELAVGIDPHFGSAWAVLSLTHALALKGEQAAKALLQAKKSKGYMPFEILADYWLATRFASSEKGEMVLEDAIARYPGSLIFRTYLGEHLNITKEYSKALQAWDRYLSLVPSNPYAMSQKAYSLARLGKMDEAISLTQKAVDLDDRSLDLKLELASRLVDAHRLSEAEKLLLPLEKHPRVFGELLLRLGYVYLLEKKDSKAEKYFIKALQMAKGPNDWRTRGRTHYDLAIVSVRKGELDNAEDHLLAAAKEGFMMRDLLKDNSDLAVLENRKRVQHLFHNHGLKLTRSIFSTSPFPLDDAGGIDPDAKRKAITGFTF